MDDALVELIETPPPAFVATRNRLVAELKAAGDATGAAAIAKLRRPALVDWALNVTVRESPELAEAWADAADRARDALGGDVRQALLALRAATTDLVGAAGDRAPAGDVAQALVRIAADPELVEALRSGTLGFDVGGGRVTAAATTKPAARADRAPRAPDVAKARAEAARAEARAALAEAEDAQQVAEQDVTRAAEELDDARRQAQAAERAHLAAQRRLAAAQRLVVEAREQLARAERPS